MHNYHFEDHHLLLRDQVRKMVDKHVAPIASEIDENNRFPEELVEVFGDMGLLQLWVPTEYGGPGADLTSVCICMSASMNWMPWNSVMAWPNWRRSRP